MRHIVSVALLVFGVGCLGQTLAVDAGSVDSGPPDSGPPDAGTTPDAGLLDGGPDAGSSGCHSDSDCSSGLTCESPACVDHARWTQPPPSLDGGWLFFDPVLNRTLIFSSNGMWAMEPSGWTLLSATAFPAGIGAAAFDSARGVAVFYVFLDAAPAVTWEWSGTDWTQRTATGPSLRYGTLAYDSARHVALLVGNRAPDSPTETWEWDGTNWSRRATPTAPPARYTTAMAYDSIRGVTVLFGGNTERGPLQDTWEWDGTSWTQRVPPASPPVGFTNMSFDSRRGLCVLFDGTSIWDWDGSAWTQSNAAGPQVQYRGGGFAMAFDSFLGVTVVFVGTLHSTETWEWDGTTWSQRAVVIFPGYHESPSMAYDSTRGAAVLYGEGLWEWNGTTWTDRSAAVGPRFRSSTALAYDAKRGTTVLFGGINDSEPEIAGNDTWTWDGSSWTLQLPAVSPGLHLRHALAYDSARGVTVLFGGNNDAFALLNDTWEWDGTNWTERTPAFSPPARERHAMAYDAARGVTVVFGGNAPDGSYLNDTWEWDGTTWLQRSPASSPSARNGDAMAYDSTRQVTILFGGYDGAINTNYATSALGDTWEWNGVNWLQRSPARSPDARQGSCMAYDSEHRETLLFGGWDPNNRTDLWEWTGTP